MKRSEINAIMRDAIAFLDSKRFLLPPFAFWGRKEWATKGSEYREIADCMLGWDFSLHHYFVADLQRAFQS
jgi:D-lyxose ketol-isomerase